LKQAPRIKTATKENNMKKLSLLALLMVFSAPLMASAQEGAPRVEISGGYSLLRISSPGTPLPGLESITGHGFSLSAAGNITKSFGIVGEFARYSKSDALGNIAPGSNLDANVQTYLFGPRFTVRTGKAEPFFHGLIGAVRGSVETTGASEAGYAFAYVLGGGLDVKVHDNFAIRLGQLDFLQARVADIGGVNSLRYSVGVVIRLSNR
jgi:hypothetical protein